MSQSPFSPNDSSPYVAQRSNHQPQRSNLGLVFAVVAGILFAGGLLCCGGGALVVKVGIDVMSAEVRSQIAKTLEIQEHIGKIETFKVKFIDSGAAEGDDELVYRVVGRKGSGTVLVDHYTDENGREVIVNAVLTMDDGRKIPITIDDL